MNLKELLCVFLLVEHNSRVLHWKSIGVNFLDAHAEAEKQYDKAAEAIDQIAERALRLGINPPEYGEALDVVHGLSDIGINMVSPADDYNREAVIESIYVNTNAIVKAIKKTHEDLDDDEIGIRSYLETLCDEYELYARYLIKRRVM